MIRQLLFIFLAMTISNITFADADDHDHDQDHEEGSEEAANVGPDKGILEFNDKDGFKLSSEALKNFDLQFMKLNSKGPWSIPASALVYSGEEVNVFRRRAGFFKRIDFKSLRKTESTLSIESTDLQDGDEVVLTGMGFLRIAELSVSGGMAHGHSH